MDPPVPSRAVEVAAQGASADATFHGSPLDVWLLLTGRRRPDEVEIEGNPSVLELCPRVAAMVPGPA